MTGLASLAALEGRWRLARRILHADGREDRFDGQAVFRRSGPRLVHDEEGVLTPATGGAPIRGTRRYVWSQRGDRLEIAFADMRPFHSIPLGVERPGTTYLCPPDRYEVVYDFSRLPDWESRWQVEGPRKAYRMTSRFSRLPR